MGGFGGKTFNGIGKTQGGWSTRIPVVVNAKGQPLKVKIAPGNRNDNLFAKSLLKGKRARNVIADLGNVPKRFKIITLMIYNFL